VRTRLQGRDAGCDSGKVRLQVPNARFGFIAAPRCGGVFFSPARTGRVIVMQFLPTGAQQFLQQLAPKPCDEGKARRPARHLCRGEGSRMG